MAFVLLPTGAMAAKLRILIVDDHPFTREGIRFFLEEAGTFQVVGEAASGHEAIDKAMELQPDIVIMDLRMPGENGVEVAARLRRQVPAAHVVMLTSENPENHVDE